MELSKTKRGTFIHGIAASQALDSSGERIDIAGVDISSLTTDGVFNFEHDSKSPSSIVGKILQAKKILKRSDCENEHHKYFWDEIKIPFIYVAGELFDGVDHKEAGEVAAMLKYDALESSNKDAKKLINFSIEGSRVEKTGSTITKCIARKVSITITPCNKTCIAEELKMDITGEKKIDSGEFSFIQDIMGKAEEPSCQLMKGEIPFLYKNEDVVIPSKEAVKEHKRLVAVLESPSHKDDKIEAKKQKKELKGYESKVKKAEKKPHPKDPVLNYDKMGPKAPTEAKQKEYAARVTAMQNKKAVTNKSENPCWDGYKKVPGKKNYEDGSCVRKKLGKYESNVRKALTASCGVGAAPSAMAGGAVLAKEHITKGEMIYTNELLKSEYMGVKGNGKIIGQTQSGKDVFSHGKVGEYQGFSPQDHAEAADFHRQMINKLPSIKDKEMHLGKMRLHQAAFSASREKQIAQQKNQMIGANPTSNMPKAGGVMGYSTQATQYAGLGKKPAMPVAPMPVAPMPIPIAPNAKVPQAAGAAKPMGMPAAKPAAMPAAKMPAPVQPKLPDSTVQPKEPKMKMAKSESFLIRKPEESDINKASHNVREQRKKVFGTKSQPAANSSMRAKHMEHIKHFADKFLGLDLKPSGGKIDPKTGQRKDEAAEVGVDKPDWRSGNVESQWNPEAAVHEIAHLMLMPKGVSLEEGQSLMDKQFSDVQKEHGYMKQKRSKYEVQPMAAEQLIRRFIGLPASQVSVPVEGKDSPPRTAVENENEVIGTRVKQGQDKKGNDKYVDLIRQARNLHPEHRQRLEDVFSRRIVFDPDKGWIPNKSIDAKINAKQQPMQSEPAEVEKAPNVVRMPKRQEKPVQADPQDQVNPPEMGNQKIAKSEQRQIMKSLGDEAFERFEKKEDLMQFLAERLPKLSEKERSAIAKAVAYTSEKKKELALKSLIETDDE